MVCKLTGGDTKNIFNGSRVELHTEKHLLFGKLKMNWHRIESIDKTPADREMLFTQSGLDLVLFIKTENNFNDTFWNDGFILKLGKAFYLPDSGDGIF